MLCVSDAFASEVLRAAADLGLRVPEDVSVVGYDDSRLAAVTRPPLTTVRQDVGAKARLAVDALVRAINDPDSAPPERELLPAELVVRASTAPRPIASPPWPPSRRRCSSPSASRAPARPRAPSRWPPSTASCG